MERLVTFVAATFKFRMLKDCLTLVGADLAIDDDHIAGFELVLQVHRVEPAAPGHSRAVADDRLEEAPAEP